MKRIACTLRRVLFGAAVVGALGFGATQAAAEPREPSLTSVCNTCWSRCPEYGGQIWNGRCLCCYP